MKDIKIILNESLENAIKYTELGRFNKTRKIFFNLTNTCSMLEVKDVEQLHGVKDAYQTQSKEELYNRLRDLKSVSIKFDNMDFGLNNTRNKVLRRYYEDDE